MIKKNRKRAQQELSSFFSPYLEKIPNNYFFPKPGHKVGTCFKDNPGAVARLLIESYHGDDNKVEKAARLARRVLEMLEYEMVNPHTDCFVDAAGSGQLKHVLGMIKKGQAIDGQHSVTGYTALHAAAEFGHLSVVKALLAAGADKHCLRKHDRNTALHCAAETGQGPVVQYLVFEAEVDKLRRNQYGMIAFDCAKEHGHDKIMDILREPPKRIDRVVLESGFLTSRGVGLQWSIPDHCGVEIEQYEVSWIPVGGTELKLYPERADHSQRVLIDASEFGQSPWVKMDQKRLLRQICRREWEQDRLRRGKSAQPDSDSDEEFVMEEEEEEEKNNNSSHKEEEEGESENMIFMLGHANITDQFIPSTKYELIVRARNVAGWSAPSEALVFSTKPDVPDAPSQVLIDVMGATCTSIDVTWTAPFSSNGRVVDTYEMHVCEHTKNEQDRQWQIVANDIQGHSFHLEKEKSGNVKIVNEFKTLHYTVENLAPETSYLMRVRARNGIGYSDFGKLSAPLKTRPATKAKEIFAKMMKIDWSESIDETVLARAIVRWEIQRTVPPVSSPLDTIAEYDWRGCEWITISDQVPGDQFTTLIRDLVPATMYYFRVRPIYKDKELLSPAWNECTVSMGLVTTEAPPEEPEPPVIVCPEAYDNKSADIFHDTMSLTWETPRANGPPVEAFSVRFTKESLGTWQKATPEVSIIVEDDMKQQRLVAGLEPGVSYRFAVRARNALGWGNFSAPSAIYQTRPSAPPAPPRLQSKSDSLMVIEWEESGDVVAKQARDGGYLQYQVQFKKWGDDEWLPVEPNDITQQNFISAADLHPVTEYIFRVRAQTKKDEWTNYSVPSAPFKTMRRF